jgi:hypothetical protein
MTQYHKVCISTTKSIAEEINLRRGKEENFSGQVSMDLEAYWDFLRQGMKFLVTKFNSKEAGFLAAAIDGTQWKLSKLDDLTAREVVAYAKFDQKLAKRHEVEIHQIEAKLNSLDLFELVALLDWSRTTRRQGLTPKQAAAIFPDPI